MKEVRNTRLCDEVHPQEEHQGVLSALRICRDVGVDRTIMSLNLCPRIRKYKSCHGTTSIFIIPKAPFLSTLDNHLVYTLKSSGRLAPFNPPLLSAITTCGHLLVTIY